MMTERRQHNDREKAEQQQREGRTKLERRHNEDRGQSTMTVTMKH